MKAWFFALLWIAIICSLVVWMKRVLDREQIAMILGFGYGFLAAIPVHLLIAAARKPKSDAVNIENSNRWIPPNDDFDDFDDGPVKPIAVMRRESGTTWQIVEDNR